MKIVISCLCFIFAGSQAGWSAACREPSTSEDILRCAVENHPDVLRAKAQLTGQEGLIRQARQRPNPEFSSESTYQSDQDQPAIKLEANLLHTFELGGKRGKRVDQAKIRQEVLRLQLQKAQEEVALRTTTHLYRLRHIQEQLHIVDESIDTLGKILTQYRSRSRLAPEQEVSLNVFHLAQGDARLRKIQLLQEEKTLAAFFSLATGMTLNDIRKALPPRTTQWSTEVGVKGASPGSAAWKEAQLGVALAQSELGLANSVAWPDLQLGPRVDMESGRGQNAQGVGGAVSLALPLYQRNEGNRALARVDVSRAEVHLAQRQRELDAELKRWREVYQASVALLQEIESVQDSEKRHADLENLFRRGLVSASLVIEAHRQIAEFAANQNAQELQAIEALWSIYALEGRILQEKL